MPVDLYRSCKSTNWGKTKAQRKEAALTEAFEEAEGESSLYPDYVGFTRRDGSIRAPDVTSFTDADDKTWVEGVTEKDAHGRYRVKKGEGVSLSTTCGGFGYKGWFYFLLPKGTAIPDSLDILHTPSRRDDGHYSLRCRNRMQKDAYEGALNTLARAAIAKAVEVGKQSLYFS